MAARSSPRERGSSECWCDKIPAPSVVPARAGVIPARAVRAAWSVRRPRASGGHPDPEAVAFAIMASSPRERGSSDRHGDRRSHRHVVPARAGVIRSSPQRTSRRPCRPRASGGHPRPPRLSRRSATSSPRERGSSGHHCPRPRWGVVVPARAGVIPRTWCWPSSSRRRPRASGGHPADMDRDAAIAWSSPRERGSSRRLNKSLLPKPVVPARAGVIRGPRKRGLSWVSRPRASGGHPSMLLRTPQ